MAVQVLDNNLPDRTVRAAVQDAVLAAMGAPSGDWNVQIHENQGSPSWHITIWGPSNFRWTRDFFGIQEQNSLDGYAFIKKAIAEVFARGPVKTRPIVYISYAYPDNKDFFVHQLAERLAAELQVQFGGPAEVVWDIDRTRPVSTWSKEVKNRVESASFVVPVISPSYVKNDDCRKEIEIFIEREHRTSLSLIFPVYFVTAGDFEDATAQPKPAWLQGMRRHNPLDLRSHRFDMNSPKTLPAIALLAKRIRDASAQISQSEAGNLDEHRPIVKTVEPIYVESLRLKDFRCFEHLELCFDRPSTLEGRWTCIAGVNGSGKSTVLQALGIALLGYPMALELGGGRLNRMRRLVDLLNRMRAEVEVILRAPGPDSLVRLRLDIDEGRIVATGGPSFAPPSPVPSWERVRQLVVAGYGATRNLSSRTDFVSEALSPDVRRQITLFEPLSQLAGAEVLLAPQTTGQPFADLFQNVIRQVFAPELEATYSGFGIRFVVGRDMVEAIDLPDGYRSATAWIADLCAFWCEKAPSLAENAVPADIQAIVLIDEIDLHLHPSLQRALIPRLRKTFPKVQWIVTTHSPLVLANFDANEIIALDRDRDGNTRELDRQILSFTSDQIYEWLMGTRPTGAAFEEEIRKSDEGLGKDPEQIARLMRVSPDTPEEAAREQVAEFKEILKTLNR